MCHIVSIKIDLCILNIFSEGFHCPVDQYVLYE